MGAIEGGGPPARGPPVDEFSFWDREGHAYASASCSHGGERFLQTAYVSPRGGGGHCY